jgi:hypothetical protein
VSQQREGGGPVRVAAFVASTPRKGRYERRKPKTKDVPTVVPWFGTLPNSPVRSASLKTFQVRPARMSALHLLPALLSTA